MDTNNDGVIRRNEWRGSAQSFDVHDWNNDNVLSGEEVNESSARKGWAVDDMAYDTLDSFEYLDVNNNERIDAREWHGTVAAFNRLDVNNDDVLSRQEMLAYRGTPRVTAFSQVGIRTRPRHLPSGVWRGLVPHPSETFVVASK